MDGAGGKGQESNPAAGWGGLTSGKCAGKAREAGREEGRVSAPAAAKPDADLGRGDVGEQIPEDFGSPQQSEHSSMTPLGAWENLRT